MQEPVVILAADHRARGVVTIEHYGRLLETIRAAMPVCDGILASMQPLRDLLSSGSIEPGKKTYLSVNRTGLAGSAFDLDDRLVARISTAKDVGASGVKHMIRIDKSDPVTAGALELLGQVLEESRSLQLDTMIEALSWREGAVARDTDSIVFAAVVAHDIGAPLLKVSVPEVSPGSARVDAVARVVESVGVPVLFLGGPRRHDASSDPDGSAVREAALSEVRDAMAGGAAGLAIGRAVLEDPHPAEMASLISEVVHSGR